jgi:transposase
MRLKDRLYAISMCAFTALKLIMDKAYEGDAMRQLALNLAASRLPPKSNRYPCAYDRKVYIRKNEIEQLFRRLKGFSRIFVRFDKLNVLFIGFVHSALIVDCLKLTRLNFIVFLFFNVKMGQAHNKDFSKGTLL